jgi:hypothetical protein
MPIPFSQFLKQVRFHVYESGAVLVLLVQRSITVCMTGPHVWVSQNAGVPNRITEGLPEVTSATYAGPIAGGIRGPSPVRF